MGCEDTNLRPFRCSPWRLCHQGPAKCSKNKHILAYFYIISLEGRLGSKWPQIFKEHGCRTSSRVRHLPVWIFFSSVGFLSQRVSSLSFFWVKVRADFGKLLQSLPTNPVRLLSAHFNLRPLNVQTCSLSCRFWIGGLCEETFIFKWLIILNLLIWYLYFPVVVYICGPLETFLNIMKLFQSEIQDPENYAIFYLDVFAESLVERKPWQNSDPDWTDPITVFKVDNTEHLTHARMKRSKIKLKTTLKTGTAIIICGMNAIFNWLSLNVWRLTGQALVRSPKHIILTVLSLLSFA